MPILLSGEATESPRGVTDGERPATPAARSWVDVDDGLWGPFEGRAPS